MKQDLIVTCDDCGLSEGINYATLDLHQKQIASTASIMTNFPAADHAYKLFAVYPSLECGIHLNLTEGYPLQKVFSPLPLTLADGHFRSRAALFTQALRPTAAYIRQVEAELTMQVEHFLASGLTGHHLTTHLHFHSVPALRDIVLQLGEKYAISWVRQHRLRFTVLPLNPLFQRRTKHRNQIASQRTHQPDFLMPIILWLRTRPDVFAQRLKILEGSIEIVVHPSLEMDETFPSGVAYLPSERVHEVRYIEQVASLLREENLFIPHNLR